VRGAGIAAAAVALGLAAGCADGPTEAGRADPEAAGGRWATWVVEDVAALRPPPPPAAGSAQARAELEEVLRLQAAPGGPDTAAVRRWSGLPTRAWTHQAVDQLEFYWALLPDVRTASPARSARIMALLHAGMYDALVAAQDAKYAFRRDAPWAADRRVRPLDRRAASPSYPSEHAVAAGAAAEILAYAFPGEDAARFRRLAREAGESRIAAGMAFRSDVEAGLELGRAVAARVVARARLDGAEAPWTGSVPSGAAVWRPTPPRRVRSPFDPAAGGWRTWTLGSGDRFRPPPPPAPGSAAFQRDLDELRRLATTRTQRQADAARYWATDAPSARWELLALEEAERRGLAPLHAARAQALVSVAMYDAFVACWEAKFHYWLLRPVSADSTLATVFSTPPFPSYPSGHSTISSAAGEVLAYLFPDRAEHFRARAEEASLSRVWAGVHYRFDVLAGEELGRKVGETVVERARGDGAGRGR
jgi:membrane-associated phospholipid phosphatase